MSNWNWGRLWEAFKEGWETAKKPPMVLLSPAQRRKVEGTSRIDMAFRWLMLYGEGVMTLLKIKYERTEEGLFECLTPR